MAEVLVDNLALLPNLTSLSYPEARKEVICMVPLYDPKDEQDLARVETLLGNAGIEYFLVREPEQGIGPFQIRVDEDDVPAALEILEPAEK